MDLIRTEADRHLLKHLRQLVAEDCPHLWQAWDDGFSEVSLANFEKAGLLQRTGDDYEIIVDELERLTADLPEKPAGPALLKATDPEARAYTDGKNWCDSTYARREHRITPKQLTRALNSEKGLYGARISARKVQHGKRGSRLVYQAADLQRLEYAIKQGREGRE